METPRRLSGYDLFKVIVAVFLLILFFVLNGKTTYPASKPISGSLPNASSTPPFGQDVGAESATIPASSTSAVLTTSTNQSVPTLTTLTPALQDASTQTLVPGRQETTTAAASTLFPSPTPLPSPTGTNTNVAPTSSAGTSTPAPQMLSACDLAGSRSRLQAGQHALILRRLNFRSSPGIQDNWLSTNLPGTRVEIIGGPECLPHVSGAYVWWQIKLPDGRTGWSAEGSQFGSFYFMDPVK